MNISFVNNNHNNSTEERTMSRQMSEHRKLCRVSRGTKVPMGSTPPTLIADMTALSLLQRRQTGRDDDDADADNGVVHFVRSYDNRNRKRLETVDSDPCYSSDGEHSNLSRNASTNSDCFLRTGDATGGCESECEYSCSKSLVTPHDSGYSSSVPFVDSANDFPSLNNDEYASLLDFTLKLGYSEAQLRTVLQRLSSSTSSSPSPLGQNNLLAELIKLGQDVSSAGGNNVGQDVGGGSSSSCSSLSPNSANQQQLGVATAFAVGVNNVSSPDSSVAAACLGVGGGGISSGLRAVVIDGSNVAMTHGHREVFSCKGVKDCVDWFKKRGHTDIKVFVPQFRKEAPRSDSPITDQHLLFELEQEKILVWTPSRRLGGRRIICYDDRYIVKTASEKDAIIVSNDEYRDVMKENPEFKKVIEERLLMYSFVDGKFMPPDDPLGRYGPQLVQFLRKGVVSSSAPNCPYGRKCTYGNKCKYSHPERPGGGYKSVTDRLRDHADFHKRISPSNSLQSPPRMLNANEACSTTAANNSKPIACRSQSLNQQGCLRQQSPSPGRQSSPQQSGLAYHQQNQQQMHLQARRTFSSAPNQHHHHSQQQNHHQQHQDFMHRDLSNRSSNPETSGFAATDCCSSPGGAPFYVGADGFLMPPSVHHIWQQQQHLGHTPIGRNLSAPGVTPSSVGCYAAGNLQNGGGASRSPASPQHQQRRKNSISDSQLNLVGQSFVDTCYSNNDDVFQTASRAGSSAPGAEPSWSSVWGPLENSSVPLFASPPPPPTGTANWSAAQHSQISRVNTLPLVAAKIPVHSTASAAPPTNNQTNVVAAASCSDEKRLKLYYHLSQLFPADVVAAVLAANPHELDAQKLCPLIIAVQNSNGQRCHGNNGESYMARSTT